MPIDIIEAALSRRLDRLGDLDGTVRLEMGTDGSIRIDGTRKPARLDRGDGEMACTLRATAAEFLGIMDGSVDAMTAVLTGRIKLEGSTAVAMKLGAALQ